MEDKPNAIIKIPIIVGKISSAISKLKYHLINQIGLSKYSNENIQPVAIK